MNSQTKKCQNCQREFTIEPEDFAFYEKVKVPAPTFCWLCRAQRRMAWRNESSLFKRKSDFSGKEIFSAFAPDAPVKVFEKEVWNSDKWNPMDYGRDYDFSKPFFKQFKELLRVVPLKNLNLVRDVRSDYSNNFTNPKNCYLAFNGNYAEDCMYGNGYTRSKGCVDTSHVSKSETCYESFWLASCNNVIFSSECESSYNLIFCKNCLGCNDCIACVGLRHKQYCIFNKQYSKEEYKKQVAEFNLGSYKKIQELKEKAYKFWLTVPNKYIVGTHSTNVSGNYISHSKKVCNSFLVIEGENLKYCQYAMEFPGSKDCYDYTAWGDKNELIYECSACGIGTNLIKFCYNVQESVRNIEYSYMCSGSSNLFGCIGLRHKQYCIFNKEYSKEEYERLVPRIIDQMNEMPYEDKQGRVYKYGEFFPIELSPFAYNETLAQEYFPLTKEGAEEQGFAWRQRDRNYVITKQASELPDHIKDVPDTITQETISCLHRGECNQNCTSAFKIIPQELEFYKKIRVPLPLLCPNCRRYERLKQRSLLNLYTRQCQCAGSKSSNGIYTNTIKHFHNNQPCPNEFETTYSPERPEIVYCEKCYLLEVV